MDAKTLFMMATLVLLSIAGSIAVTSARVKTYRGFGHWTAFFVLLGVAQLFLGLRGVVPDFISVFFGNLAAMAAVAFFAQGSHLFHRFRGASPNRVTAPLFTAAMAGIGYYTFVAPSLTPRIVIGMTTVGVSLWLICFLHLREDKAWETLPEKVNFLTLGLFGLFCFFRAGHALAYPVAHLLDEGWVLTTFIILLTCFSIFNLVSCLLLNQERTNVELAEARASLDRLINNLPGIVYRVQLFGEELVEFAGGDGHSLMGLPTEGLMGRPRAEFDRLIDPGDMEKGKQAVIEALMARRQYEIVINVRGPNGQRRVLMDRGVGVYDHAGIPVYREGFLIDMTERVEAEEEKAKLVGELKAALDEVKALSGLIPICAGCKKIRDDGGYWNQLEAYLAERTGARFSHGLCPDCALEYYPEAREEILAKGGVRRPR